MSNFDQAKAYIVGGGIASLSAAMHGVYGLLGLKNEIPPIYNGTARPQVAMASLRTLMG